MFSKDGSDFEWLTEVDMPLNQELKPRYGNQSKKKKTSYILFKNGPCGGGGWSKYIHYCTNIN